MALINLTIRCLESKPCDLTAEMPASEAVAAIGWSTDCPVCGGDVEIGSEYSKTTGESA